MSIEVRASQIADLVNADYGLDYSSAAEIAYNLLEQCPELSDAKDDFQMASIVASLIEYQ